MNPPDTLDAYLDALTDELPVAPRRLRRILAEAEDHLRSAIDAKTAAGLDPVEAQRQAIAEFGAPSLVARGFLRNDPVDVLRLVEPVGVSLLGLAAVGMIAVALSGLVALAMGAVAGKTFVSGDAPGVVYTQARCAEFLEYFPHARDCAAAAVDHHFEEVVFYRLALGVLGLLALGAWFAAMRLRHGARMPAAFAPTIGAALFGVAALGLISIGGMPALFGASNGTGANLSGGFVSLVFFAAFALRLLPLLSHSVEESPPAVSAKA